MAKEFKKINLLLRLGIISGVLMIITLLGFMKKNEELTYKTESNIPLLDFDTPTAHADNGSGSGSGSGTAGDGDGTAGGGGGGSSGDYHDGAP